MDSAQIEGDMTQLEKQEGIEEGYRCVVDMDLEKFFDKVNHDRLMGNLAKKIKDKTLLKLIRKYLQSGVLINGVVLESKEGTPQGGLCKASHKPPWGATKLTKFVNKLGPIRSIAGVVLDVFFAAKEEYDEAKHEQELREARADIRSEFRQVAKEIRSEFEQNIEEAILPFFQKELVVIEQQQKQIRQTETSKEQSLRKIEDLLIKVRARLPK